jgi:anti-sigma B factor antagonist
MNISTSTAATATVITLEGNLMGGPDAAALNQKIHDLVAAGTRNVILDLRQMQFMNSSGLGLLISGASTLKSAGGALKLAGASEKILALIKITRLEKVFESFATVEDAAASFTR